MSSKPTMPVAALDMDGTVFFGFAPAIFCIRLWWNTYLHRAAHLTQIERQLCPLSQPCGPAWLLSREGLHDGARGFRHEGFACALAVQPGEMQRRPEFHPDGLPGRLTAPAWPCIVGAVD